MTTDTSRRLKCAACGLLCMLAAAASAPADSTDSSQNYKKFIPKVHGVLRTFFEQSTATGDSRFIVQNARLNASGYVMPWLNYFMQVDFCAMGKIKILDVYASVEPVAGLKLQLGQSKAPFSTQSARAPHEYHFVTEPLTAAPSSIRSVGLRVNWTVPRTPIHLDGGIYNSTDMLDHNSWNRSLLYSARLWSRLPCGFQPSVGFMSRQPGGKGRGVRYNQADVTLSYFGSRLFLEGEYLYRHFTGHAHKATHIYSFMIDYGFPIEARMADRLSVQGRFDGMSDYSTGFVSDEGMIVTNEPSHRRATVGVTATKKVGVLLCSFLINYEQYFYGHTSGAKTASNNNMLQAGVVVRF